jgi:hypothetical protein
MQMTTKADLESALSEAQGAREKAIKAVLRELVSPRSGAPSQNELYPMTPALSRALYALKRASDWCFGADIELKEFTASEEAKSRT